MLPPSAAALIALAPFTCGAQDAPDVEQELARVQGRMDEGEWGQARQDLLELLGTLPDRVTWRAHASRLGAMLQRAVFWTQTEEPPVAELFAGELVEYDRRRGYLHLRYEKPSQRGDFQMQELDSGLRVGGVHLPSTETFFLHSIEFSGPYGATYHYHPVRYFRPDFLVAVDPPTILRVGYVTPSERGRDRIAIQGQVVTCDGPERFDRFRDVRPSDGDDAMRIDVTDTSVRVRRGSRIQITAPKPREAFGQLAIEGDARRIRMGEDGFPHGIIEVQGEAGPWVRARLDAAVADEWRAFERTWRLAEHLPEPVATWQAELDALERTPATELAPYPGEATEELDGYARELDRRIAAGAAPTDLLWLDRVDERLPRPVMRWFRARLMGAMGRTERQLQELRELERACPDFLPARQAAVEALLREERLDPALAELSRALTRWPGEARLVELQIELLLRRGRLADARAALAAARTARADPVLLAELGATLERYERGPDWRARETHESEHYVVSAPADAALCRRMARELERSRRAYRGLWDEAPDEPQQKQRVYLFESEEAYRAYAARTMRAEPQRTLGLYDPVLKQILIWNDPDRDALMRTLRHEGLHAYLDQHLEHAPMWLNEGLAEYYEAARTPSGAWVVGSLHADALAALEARLCPKHPPGETHVQLVELATLLEVERDAFYAEPELYYPQAWSLVRFLLHSTRSNRELVRGLLRELRAGAEAAEASRKVFAEVDLEALGKDWAAGVEELRGR